MAHKDEVIAQTKWLEFIKRNYSNGKYSGEWDFVRRVSKVGRKPIVVIIARTIVTKSFIVIKQYRAPFDDYNYEVPAGLVDDDEKLSEASLRELKEETGYTGNVISISGPIASSAGMTDEVTHMVYIDVHEEPSFKPSPEATEDIEVIKLHPNNIREFLKMNEEGGHVFGAKLYSVLKEQV